MLVSEVIYSSLRKLGLVASGESAETEELSDALTAFQVMLRSWAAEKILVYASVQESFSISAGTYLYTWGTGGTFNTARPNEVIGGYIRDSSSVDHPIDVVTEAKYRSVSVKSTVARPYMLYPHMRYPLAYMYFYPVPQDSETLYVTSFKPFTETSSFSSISDTLAFPVDYEEAMVYNLAVRIAPEYGKIVPAEVVAIASKSHDRLLVKHAADQVEPVVLTFPLGSGGGAGRYSINSDSYH